MGERIVSVPLAKSKVKKEKAIFKMPHVYVILTTLLILCYVLTLIIPKGAFDREVRADGINMILPGTFHYIQADNLTPFDLLFSITNGLVQAGPIIFGGLMMGGLFAIVEKTGLLAIVIQSVMRVFSNHRIWAIPTLMIPMAIFTTITGAFELALIYIPVMIPLMLRLGYDRFTAFSLVIVANAAGFSVALTAPATVGLAQTISELPLYSGLSFRIVVLAIVLFVGVVHVMRYAKKIEKNPELSYLYNDGLNGEFVEEGQAYVKMTKRHIIALIALLSGLVVMVYGLIVWKWYFIEIGGWYAFIGIMIGLICGFSPSKVAETFNEGFKIVTIALIVIGLARAISVVLDKGQILDTIIYGLTNIVEGLPPVLAALMMLVVQTVFNFLVGSGSGQALITMPIMSGLADILGVTRQTAVLAFQFGDGFSNIVYPVGLVIALLAFAKISYWKWLKFSLPLVAVWYGISAIAVIVAQLIGL